MKRTIQYLSILALAALATASCQKMAEELTEKMESNRFEGKTVVLHASWANETSSKTAVQEDGVSVWWTTGEEINVFHGTAYAGKFTSNNEEAAPHAEFTGILDRLDGTFENDNDVFWAVYPYNENNYFNGETVTIAVPSAQTASEGTFADKLFPAVAKSSGTDLKFYNVCGGACFTVATEGIRSITFIGKNNEPMAGMLAVSMDDNGRPVVQSVYSAATQVKVYAPTIEGFEPGKKYYAVIVPQSMQNGLTVEYRTATKIATLELGSVNVLRGKFGLLTARDANLDFEDMTDIPVDRFAFADANFAEYVFSTFDTDGNDELSVEEREAVTWMDFCTDEITSLGGIKLFTNLEGLSCYGSREYNSSTRQYESKGQLTSIDISANTKLTYLDCYANQIEELDVSGLNKLAYLYCRYNKLSSLDVSHNTELIRLYCNYNRIESLDFSNNVKLKSLDLANNLLSAINLSSLSELLELSCSANRLESLDISANENLNTLYCSSNNLGHIDVSHNAFLSDLSCYNCGLTSLDISNNPELVYLQCYDNALTGIDVSNNPKLEILYIWYNMIGALDVTANPELRRLDCENCGLTSLDLSKNPKLEYLYCRGNYFSELDVSNNLNICHLVCTNCEDLSSLYLLEGQSIETLYKDDWTEIVYVHPLYKSDFEDVAFANYIFETFDEDGDGVISDKERRNINAIEINNSQVASVKGIEFLPNLASLTVKNSQLSSIDLSGNNLWQLVIPGNKIKSLDLSGQTMLYNLDCSSNNISDLDLSSQFILNYLDCSSNSISELDLSNNNNLVFLNFSGNQISSIDLTGKGELLRLWCSSNGLTKLDLSANPKIEQLYCDGNAFTELDFSSNLRLKTLVCNDNASLTTVWVAKGHTFDSLVKDENTIIDYKSSGEGGKSEGFENGDEGDWD